MGNGHLTADMIHDPEVAVVVFGILDVPRLLSPGRTAKICKSYYPLLDFLYSSFQGRYVTGFITSDRSTSQEDVVSTHLFSTMILLLFAAPV